MAPHISRVVVVGLTVRSFCELHGLVEDRDENQMVWVSRSANEGWVTIGIVEVVYHCSVCHE